MPFREAKREKALARIALYGVSKAGKTRTGLIIAKALGGDKVAVIDSEHGSSEKYADRYNFQILELENHHPESYRQGIVEAAEQGFQVLLIDSLSHAWMGTKGILELVDAETPSGGSSFTSGWSKVRPIESQFWNTLLSVPMHVICTLRAKQQYIEDEYQRGGQTKTRFRKVGMGPIQREGLEYEFDIVGELDLDHNLTIVGTRYDELPEGEIIPKPDEKFGAQIADLLARGAEPEKKPDADPEKVAELEKLLLEEGNLDEKQIRDVLSSKRVESGGVLPPDWIDRSLEKVKARIEAKGTEEKKEEETKA